MKKQQLNQKWEQRMIASVTQRLGVSVTLKEWQRRLNGIDVPIFNVPDTHRHLAIELGLSVSP